MKSILFVILVKKYKKTLSESSKSAILFLFRGSVLCPAVFFTFETEDVELRFNADDHEYEEDFEKAVADHYSREFSGANTGKDHIRRVGSRYRY